MPPWKDAAMEAVSLAEWERDYLQLRWIGRGGPLAPAFPPSQPVLRSGESPCPPARGYP
jgi:hypothetical protein